MIPGPTDTSKKGAPPTKDDEVAEQPPAGEADVFDQLSDVYVPPDGQISKEEPEPAAAPKKGKVAQVRDTETPKAKAAAPTGEGLDAYLDRIEQSPAGDMAAAEALFQTLISTSDSSQRKSAFNKLVGIHNDEDSTGDQRASVIKVFERTRESGTDDIFVIALTASSKLKGEEYAQLKDNLIAFTAKASEGGTLATNAAYGEAYIEAIERYAKSNPTSAARASGVICEVWMQSPSVKALWDGFMTIAATGISYEIETPGGNATTSLHKEAAAGFWTAFGQLSSDEQIAIAVETVNLIGPEVSDLHMEILEDLSGKHSDEIRDAMEERVLMFLSTSNLGKRDPKALKAVLGNITDSKRKRCPKGDEACQDAIDQLRDKLRQVSPLIQLSPNVTSHNYFDLAGEAVEHRANSYGINFDWMGSTHSRLGTRPLVGAYFHGSAGNMAAGLRAGMGWSIGSGLFAIKAPISAGWLYVKGEDASGSVPIEFIGTGVNADQTAYTMRPHDMGMYMHAGTLTFDPEIHFMFARTDLGQGKSFSFGAFIALSAGLYAGALSDDGCSYAYNPGDGNLEVRPTADGVEYTLDGGGITGADRCRGNAFSLGTIFGGSVGLTGEFGL